MGEITAIKFRMGAQRKNIRAAYTREIGTTDLAKIWAQLTVEDMFRKKIKL